jgi:hypothetical protein
MAVDEGAGLIYVLYQLAPLYRQIAILEGKSGALIGIVPGRLDRPLTTASALVVDEPAGVLLVADGKEVLPFDLATMSWREDITFRARGALSQLVVDPVQGLLYAIERPGTGDNADGNRLIIARQSR